MSKSHKHTPIFGIACHTAGAVKEYKRTFHKHRRAVLRELIAHGEYEKAEVEPRYELWDDPRDGKFYWKNAPEKVMRK